MTKDGKRRIFVINCGSTSIKLAIYEETQCVLKENLSMDMELITKYENNLQQLPERNRLIQEFLTRPGVEPETFDMVASRGGTPPECRTGAYAVNEWMLDVLTFAPKTPHVSSLSCMIGDPIAKKYNIPHIVYDCVNCDDRDEISKHTGIPGILFSGGTHVLNARATARKLAERMGKPLAETRFIVCHMGGGCSFNAVEGGRIIDYINDYRGVITPERSGNLPNNELIDLCYSGKYTRAEMQKLVMGRSGFYAYIGTSDAVAVEKMADEGNELAAWLYELMAYNVAKNIGALVPVFRGEFDAIILTGGMAYSRRLTNSIVDRVSCLGHVEIIPGEMEMEALALGGLRVLDGTEEAMEFDLMPAGFATKEEFYAKFGHRS